MSTQPISRLRAISAEQPIDTNHDQIASPQELAAAVSSLVGRAVLADRSADAVRRDLQHARSFPGQIYGPIYGGPGNGQIYGPIYDHGRYDSLLSELRYHENQAAQLRSQADEVRAAMRASDGPIPLMSDDFRARFTQIPGEARSALVKADVRGNNDGVLTRKEYDEFNKRPFLGVLGKKRFEGHFGKQAHNTVLAALAPPKTINAAR